MTITSDYKGVPISRLIDTRHELTALIKQNLYGKGSKDEGRAALIARNKLDEFIFNATDDVFTSGNAADLAPLKQAIILETYTELLDILKDYRDRFGRGGKATKQGMLAIVSDPDVFGRFTPDYQGKIQAIVTGSSLLANRRFDQLDVQIRTEAGRFMSSSPGRTDEGVGPMFGLGRTAKMWGESIAAGATNTGNVTATVGSKLVLNWHGTPTQRDGVLQMLPKMRDRLMPGVELASFADAVIASIHDDGLSSDNDGSNIQTLAMLWRVFTTQLDDGTYGDLVAHANMHAAFELHEQPNDEFKVTWKISVMRGRTP